MYHLHDRATMAHALALDLNLRIRALLVSRIEALVTNDGDLTDYTEFVVVEAEDSEADIVRAIGLSPLIEPINGCRFGEAGFYPSWDWLVRGKGWFEMVITFGSSFGYHLIIEDDASVQSPLLLMCRYYATDNRGDPADT